MDAAGPQAAAAAQARAAEAAPAHARRVAALLVEHQLHPHAQLHPSWLPPDWPARWRRPLALGPQGRAALDAQLAARLPPGEAFDADFGSPGKRLALLDRRALRLAALYCGIAAHRPLLHERALAVPAARALRRLGPGAGRFVRERLPALPALRMESASLLQRPAALPRTVWHRGARLLLALLAPHGEGLLLRTRWRLPRRVAAGAVPVLGAEARCQLEELLLLAVVPERLPTWDWLF